MMKMKVPSLLLALLFMSSPSLHAEVVAKAVEYRSGDQACESWHAYDDAVKGPRPSVLIVHQWTGLTDYEKMRAGMLAKLGYNVFALDIYGTGIRPQPPESAKMSGKFKEDRALFRERGTGVLELARSGAEVAGVVSFHGGLGTPTPEDAKNISCQTLILHGADDPFVPPAEVGAFKTGMKDAGKEYEFVAYPGAVHAFTQKMAGDDPSKGAAYQAEADAKSWEEMRGFFDKIFGKDL